MTDDTLLAPFDDDVFRQVAAANDIDFEALQNAVADHQRTMRENPGVEDLVYEWRKQYDDPVLVRTPDLFVVAVTPTVWEEYGEYLDFEPDRLAAVSAVHQEQTIRTDAVDVSAIPEGHTALVAGRH
ncbi:hypothetical protein NDI56_04415 [Haloarcula sp. S1CR25-12]|uniref:DUF8048 domain-containing protein n=1 Tax=Haloarcula saliterrae TaxID=2950534 RepID=A0ABU2F9Y5_9EURY|nr:hypothetical protein [Haloarcula sp. S1CR25-12]MDS0258655.1 hypothetical protein [Haloarcula sp. S1CR25-12]